MIDLFDNFYKGKKVLVTGHTGFKGSWLCIWLQELGAHVVGVSLDPYTYRDNYVLSHIGERMCADLRCDIRDEVAVKRIFHQEQPDIVFHLAAQPLVRLSYALPVQTYSTNLMGTIHVMEAIRATPNVKVGVMVTTDKCYENKETYRGYEEDDPFGGYDPYSSSKGACEIAISSWRRSFFNPAEYAKTHHVSLSSVRAGNVIGGGDWSDDRIVPDCICALEKGDPIPIRSPKSVRPWQHVLEPLYGYMLLAKYQWEKPTEFAEGWNFGPDENTVLTVWEMAEEIANGYGGGRLIDASDKDNPHESCILKLNINKARFRLGWMPKMNAHQSIALTVDWYKRYRYEDVYQLCVEEIQRYVDL